MGNVDAADSREAGKLDRFLLFLVLPLDWIRQILAEIQTALSGRLGSSSWSEILHFRDRFVGSASHCVRGLLYQHHQKEAMMYSMNPSVPPGSYLAPHLLHLLLVQHRLFALA